MVRSTSVRRALLIGSLAALALGAGTLAAIRVTVARAARERVYDIASAPERAVAIVFGASLGSRVLRDRVETAAALYRAQKVKHLLLTGDDRHESYDEPRAMRRMALQLGVPDSAIVLDYAGRRTYDSCARASAIFQLDGAILITQRFHLTRALYLCERLGLPGAVGVAADRQGYGGGGGARLWARELLADVKAWWDLNVRHPGFVGGPALPITDDAPSKNR
jgi:SanA protein